MSLRNTLVTLVSAGYTDGWHDITAVSPVKVLSGANEGHTGVEVTGMVSASTKLSAAELALGGSNITATAAEINKLDGFSGSATELNYLKNLYDKIKPLENELKFIFITSECYLRLSDNEFDHPIKHGDDELTIIITKSVNTKCERCWHLNESVGKIKDTPTICQRCFDNVHGDGE